MKHNVKIVEPEDFMASLPELLDQVESVPLVISGSSMVPFLVHGRDTVYLSKAKAPLKRGDMILYRRDGGAYVLHRIFRREGDCFTLVGDAQIFLEPGIRTDQVIAVVTAVHRKGKLLKKGSFCWLFFEKIWIRMVPLRPLAGKVWSRLRKLWK